MIRVRFFKGDILSQPRLIIYRGRVKISGHPYQIPWKVIRFGVEKRPLFSERHGYQNWKYYFGGRLSIWTAKNSSR